MGERVRMTRVSRGPRSTKARKIKISARKKPTTPDIARKKKDWFDRSAGRKVPVNSRFTRIITGKAIHSLMWVTASEPTRFPAAE